MLNSETQTIVVEASARAIATSGHSGVNVVPVSVVKVESEVIYLYNFFMSKTIENLLANPEVAFAAWDGLFGVQIKARAEYITAGELFDDAVKDMKERFPDRTLSGIIKLSPTAVYDISAGPKAGQLIGGSE